MQRLLKRTAYAKKQADARNAKYAAHLIADEEYQNWRQLRLQKATQKGYIKDEQRRRRTVHETGNLAPRYDVGENAHTYGTIDANILNGPTRSWKQYKDEVWPFEEGDRVVLTTGKDRGKIGRISHIDMENGTAKIGGLLMVDYFIPDFIREEHTVDYQQDPIQAYPLPVSLKDIKLIHPIRDQRTGGFKDAIIDEVICKGRGWNQKTREFQKGTRHLPKGIGGMIPWPELEDPEEIPAFDDDTYRVDVDQVVDGSMTRPFLLSAPMPPSVIDELRNKYSKFRTRHEDWFIEKKMEQDRVEERAKRMSRMVSTPLMELKEKSRLDKLAKTEELTDEQLMKIGNVMAVERMNAVAEAATYSTRREGGMAAAEARANKS